MQMLEQYFQNCLTKRFINLSSVSPKVRRNHIEKLLLRKKAITISLQNIQKNRYFMKTFLLLPLLCGALN